MKQEIELGRLRDYVGFRLRRIQNNLSKDFMAATREYKLRSGMFTALELIAANPGISQNAVADEVGQDKSAIVQVIDNLQSNGWIKREQSKTDRRRNELRCTAEGKRVLKDLFDKVEQVEGKVLHQLSKSELTQLTRLLDRIYDAL